MSDVYSTDVRAASMQMLSKSNTDSIEETTYTVKIDDNIVKDALPLLTSKLLEVISNPSVTSEIKQNFFGIRTTEQPCYASQERRCSESSTDSSTSTSLLLSAKNQMQMSPTLKQGDLGYDYDHGKILGQPELSSKPVSLDTNRLFLCLVILILITVISTLAFCSILLQIWFKANISSSISFENSFVRVHLNEEANEFLVNSFDEYKALIQNRKNFNIKLVISIATPGDWPTGVQIPKLDHITNISVKGHFHGKKLVELLSSISSLEMLTIDNESNSLCTETKQMIGTLEGKSKPATSLKAIILKHFTFSCTDMLEIIHENIKLTSLQKFAFKNGELNENNIKYLDKILIQFKQSLQQLEILDTTINSTLFKQPSFLFFGNLKKLALDVNGPVHVLSTSMTNICSLFPNLENLSLGNGLHNLNDISKVFGCHHLKAVQLSISLPKDYDEFSLDFLSDAYLCLQSADIMLIYGNLLEGAECAENKIILGSKKMSDNLLVNIRITSNCELTLL